MCISMRPVLEFLADFSLLLNDTPVIYPMFTIPNRKIASECVSEIKLLVTYKRAVIKELEDYQSIKNTTSNTNTCCLVSILLINQMECLCLL